MNQQVKDLVEAVRSILPGFEFYDGVATTSTPDIEMLERVYHAVDVTYAPSRPDSSVCPCIHNCKWCREHDTPSEIRAYDGPLGVFEGYGDADNS